MNALKDLPGACRTSTSRSSRRTWARATARSPAAIRPAGDNGHVPVHAARDLHGDDAADRARRSSPTSAASPNYTRPTSRRVLLHRRARRDGLRLRAPVRVGHCARWAPTACRRPPRTRASCAPDALLAIIMVTNEDDCSAPRRRRRPLRHRRRTRTSSSQLGPPGELPLQRVRPPLRRRAPAPAGAGRRRERDGHAARTARRPNATACWFPSPSSSPDLKALKAAPDSEIVVAAIAGPAGAVHGAMEGPERRGHVVRSAPLPVAADRALVHGDRRQLRRSGRPHRRLGQGVRRERDRVVDLRRELRARRCSRSPAGSAAC